MSSRRERFAQTARAWWMSTTQMPRTETTWASSLRRAVAVTVFLAAGLITGSLHPYLNGSFGALTTGLFDAALPRREVAKVLAAVTVASTAVAYIASMLGGTWWTVPFLALLAYIHGALSSGASARALTVVSTLSTLALGIIYSGLALPRPTAAQAALWVFIGSAVTSLSWLLVWRRERSGFIRRCLANDVRTVRGMLSSHSMSGAQTTEAAAADLHVAGVIDAAGLPAHQRKAARRALEHIEMVRRSIIAWVVLRAPGSVSRAEVAERLSEIARDFESRRGRTLPQTPLPLHDWQCDRDLAERTAGLQRQPAAVRRAFADHARESSRPAAGGGTRGRRWWRDCNPSSDSGRHGVRLAVAIAVAQILALLTPLGHSYWIPLTVAMVVKPDWSYTVIRTSTRTLGNLAAVCFVGLLVMAVPGVGLLEALLCFVLAALTFRFLTGNYGVESFALAGTILVLDTTSNPSPDVVVDRLVATLVGAAVALAVSWAIPTWTSASSSHQAARLAEALRSWVDCVADGLRNPAAFDFDTSYHLGVRMRMSAVALRPAAQGVLLEPMSRTHSFALIDLLDASERTAGYLSALSAYAAGMQERGEAGLADHRQVDRAQADVRAAGRALGAAPVPAAQADTAPFDPLPTALHPQTLLPEEVTVIEAAVVRVGGAAAEFRWAAERLAGTG